jgi:hypothetical protein
MPNFVGQKDKTIKITSERLAAVDRLLIEGLARIIREGKTGNDFAELQAT